MTDLARKYRPRRLSRFVGNESTVRTVRGIFEGDPEDVPQAWLITGPTGTGKTSMGRWISMRLNCEAPSGVDPCGKCWSCSAMAKNPPEHDCHIEVNSADKRKLEDARDIIASARFRPVRGRYRVFMLDEPQGLIAQAQETLLKPLEDPPPQTVWILCTTDPGKLKKAVVGRCEAGNLTMRLVDAQTLGAHLGRIASKEGQDLPPEACTTIAELSGLHPRNAVSTLGRVLKYIKASGKSSTDIKAKSIHAAVTQILEEEESKSPYQGALNAAMALVDHDLIKAIKSIHCGVVAEVVLGMMASHWETIILFVVGDSQLVPNSRRWVIHKYKLNSRKYSLRSLLNAGEVLTKNLERAKAHLIDDEYLLTMTILGMWECMTAEFRNMEPREG